MCLPMHEEPVRKQMKCCEASTPYLNMCKSGAYINVLQIDIQNIFIGAPNQKTEYTRFVPQ